MSETAYPQIWATVSTQFVERDPAPGDARYIPVDAPAACTFEVYQEARDPVLEAALAAKTPARRTNAARPAG